MPYTLAVFSRENPIYVIDQWEVHSELSAQKVLTLRQQGYRVAYWNGTRKLHSRDHELVYSFGFPINLTTVENEDGWEMLAFFIKRFTEFGDISMDYLCQEWTLYTVMPITEEQIKFLEDFLKIDIELNKVDNVKVGWMVWEWRQSVEGHWSTGSK